MFSKSSKWELGFVHYITKFTISRFTISRFKCNNITPSHWNNDPDKINEQISMLNGLPGNAKLSNMKTLFDVQLQFCIAIYSTVLMHFYFKFRNNDDCYSLVNLVDN